MVHLDPSDAASAPGGKAAWRSHKRKFYWLSGYFSLSLNCWRIDCLKYKKGPY
jgi:hypothetical protein